MNRICKSPFIFTCLLLTILLAGGCATSFIRETLQPSSLKTYQNNRKSVKVHMKDGSLYLLDSLVTYEDRDTVKGFGHLYNQDRVVTAFNRDGNKKIIAPPFVIPLSDIALAEANRIEDLNGKILAMSLLSAASAILAGYCILNPKACFGSCPTFYSWDGNDTTLMAEGFSSSILRAFEKEDIDMLYNAKITGPVFHLKMKNEALETHVIHDADLLLMEKSGNDRIFATEDGEFYNTSDIISPASCVAEEGDCLDAVIGMDNKERFSKSNPKNLAEKENIIITFDNVPEGETGLVIGCRQTLMTTYLFYQSLAYLGSKAGYFAARIESGDKTLRKKVDRVWDVLGGIELYVLNERNKWEQFGQLQEMGPLSTDIHLFKLPVTGRKNLKIKLCMTQGLWRINYLALGNIGQKVDPVIIKPFAVINKNCAETNVIQGIKDELITIPGDVYDLCYRLPESNGNFEIFLRSKGYYIEWMRDPWLQDEDIRKAALFFGFPGIFMRKAAEDFKKAEPSMEDSFWNSKYVRKN